MSEIPRHGHARLAPGSVVAFLLPSGQLAYVQYVRPSWAGPLIRVCVGTYDEPLPMAQVRDLVARPSLFRAQFPIDMVTDHEENVVVTRLPVPADEAELPPFRYSDPWPPDYSNGAVIDPGGAGRLSGAEFAARHPGVDVSSLPLFDVPFYSTLVRMIEVQWTPRPEWDASLGILLRPRILGENRRPERPSASASVASKRGGVSTSYLARFSDKASAERAFEKVLELPEVSADVVEPDEESDEESDQWLLVAARAGTPNWDLEEQMETIAEEHGGSYEGNLVGPFH